MATGLRLSSDRRADPSGRGAGLAGATANRTVHSSHACRQQPGPVIQWLAGAQQRRGGVRSRPAGLAAPGGRSAALGRAAVCETARRRTHFRLEMNRRRDASVSIK